MHINRLVERFLTETGLPPTKFGGLAARDPRASFRYAKRTRDRRTDGGTPARVHERLSHPAVRSAEDRSMTRTNQTIRALGKLLPGATFSISSCRDWYSITFAGQQLTIIA